MDLAATFYLSVYGLSALAGGILAWAEQAPSVTVLAAPTAIAALFLNERYHTVRLNAFWSGLLGSVAFVYPLYELTTGNEEARLLFGAHLLTILQGVFLFYHKKAHQYWYLCAISCLQIALAAVLTSAPMFGLLILIYMLSALWTLSVFTLLLARLRYGRGESVATAPGDWEWPELDESPRSSTRRAKPANHLVPSSDYRSSFQCDPRETDINWRFVVGVGAMSSSALLLGLLFFLLTPRWWIGPGNPFQDVGLEGSRALTGFSDKVQLGDFGRILESSAPVLELRLTDSKTDQPIDLHAYLAEIGQTEPLLRGAVLGKYDQGEWYPLRFPSPPRLNRRPTYRPNPTERRYACQTIRLEAIGSRSLFSLADPEYGSIEDQMGEILISPPSRTLYRTSESSLLRGAIRYQLNVPRREQRSTRPLYHVPFAVPKPISPLDEAARIEAIKRMILPDYLECSPKFVTVHELANTILRRAAPANPTPAQFAASVVSYLRDSGEFQYSLDQSLLDPALDPVEDFLKNRKSGHCQYFATALALLLRSAGVPSRVVTGFKGGIESPETGQLEVQQRHAHAWVEAYIEDAWVTLDATPAAREDSVEAIGERVRWYHQVFTFASSLWNDYVLNLSFSKQQRDLYAPFQNLATTVTSQLRGTSSFWQSIQKHLATFWKHPEQWFSLQGFLTASMLMLVLLGLFYLVRSLVGLLGRLLLGSTVGRRGIHIEFYERFLKLLEPLGLVPQEHQTQLEFAEQVEATWKARELPQEFLPLAHDLSVTFYRLRFGGESLTSAQEQDIMLRLQQLEARLRQS